ncbi:hypothetical protein Baya_10112 [Bagarius yarrelli]|uniref:Uncharacterized protein n=1 Tax=Bagarius yarrelli TaxID=175774 RepID=A0A556UEY9_BAGYA|nr:hypothetical protein Baya_10112 [Bagarius yarrelli]
MTTSSQAHREGNAVVHLYPHASGRPAAATFTHPHRSLGFGSSVSLLLFYTTAAHSPAKNTDPASKSNQMPVLGVALHPIQTWLPESRPEN